MSDSAELVMRAWFKKPWLSVSGESDTWDMAWAGVMDRGYGGVGERSRRVVVDKSVSVALFRLESWIRM